LTPACAGVYAAWLRKQPLYVGSSKNLAKRVVNNKRTEKGRNEALLRCDRMEIYECDSLAQARHLEVELIGLYAPQYNRTGHFQSSRSFQRLRLEHAKLFGAPSPLPSAHYSGGTCSPLLSTRTLILKAIVNRITKGLDSASPRYSTLRRLPLELSIDAIIAVADGMKEDLQRKANQGVRRGDLNQALIALGNIQAVDDFVYALKIRSGSQLGLPKPPRKQPKSPLRQHLEAEEAKAAQRLTSPLKRGGSGLGNSRPVTSASQKSSDGQVTSQSWKIGESVPAVEPQPSEAKKSQELPEQLLLPETGGPVAAKKRRSA
jgi:hypothetical protein